MNDRTESTVRARRWALLPAIAAIALFAGLPAAVAADQQRSDEAPDSRLSHQMAGINSDNGDARAQAPAPVVRRHHHAR
jgi:hypothetical protein